MHTSSRLPRPSHDLLPRRPPAHSSRRSRHLPPLLLRCPPRHQRHRRPLQPRCLRRSCRHLLRPPSSTTRRSRSCSRRPGPPPKFQLPPPPPQPGRLPWAAAPSRRWSARREGHPQRVAPSRRWRRTWHPCLARQRRPSTWGAARHRQPLRPGPPHGHRAGRGAGPGPSRRTPIERHRRLVCRRAEPPDLLVDGVPQPGRAADPRVQPRVSRRRCRTSPRSCSCSSGRTTISTARWTRWLETSRRSKKSRFGPRGSWRSGPRRSEGSC